MEVCKMIYKKLYTFKMPSFEYFKDELGWNIETLDDLLYMLDKMTEDELREFGNVEIDTKITIDK
jgi:hypothetical protein